MTQYIDKSALVAEIERRIKVSQDYAECNLTESTRIGNQAQLLELNDILSFLDTLEVKEGNDSEKDEDYINDLIDFFHQNNKLKNTKTDIISWLKSLKDNSINL